MDEEGPAEQESWSPVHRERSQTSGSLSEGSGKKRKQQGAPGMGQRGPEPQTSDDKEPCTKRVKPVTKTLSGSGAPSAKVTPLKRLSQSIQRSISFKTEPRPPGYVPPSRTGGCRRRSSKLWSETFDRVSEELSAHEVKRQEVIFELMQGEQQLVDDLNLVKKNYYEPMLTLAILPEAELREIFGTLDSLAPLHEDLLGRLMGLRQEDGTVPELGPTLLDWLPRLRAYESYCCHQVWAKARLDRCKREPAVGEFLRLCQESAFSRKLELWSFLDLPRSRLVKYPLLLREVLRQTPPEHPDHGALQRAVALAQDLVGLINRRTGEAECRYYQQRLSYPDGTPRHPSIQRSSLLLCHGELRNSKGQRLHVFLFQEALVLTRPILQGEQVMFQVQGPPLPVAQLEVQDLPDGGARLGGALRERARSCLRVSAGAQAHMLQAADAFDKQQWLSRLRQALVPRPPVELDCSLGPLAALRLDCDPPMDHT
ncbi:rho guanine nucleotide exchange factor 3-like isoform X1 [Gopherus flavomarginatus]|uniref:rho guanine nucleotide exchange factor 3-like isoform X1 n=1 Tax=Gopherus flavomarginatus TaxID=286002 RepID=UPI0021CC4AB7|nr:rho guanine nucleotide exchange factor 3-like isoform X1 [Gopherus flavomarginatus]